MSFSSEVKEELSKHISSARHCCIAEIAAIISLCGHIIINAENRYSVKISTENLAVARKYQMLIRKVYGFNAEITIRTAKGIKKNCTYTITVNHHDEALKILQTVKLINNDYDIVEDLSVDNIVIRNMCCKRAFIRGAFLATGSITDPEKSYHFEIVCQTNDKAKQICDIIKCFDIEARIVLRKKHYVVYIKEGSGIVDILNVMEAFVSLMNFENTRIIKDVRNRVNRKVNCETANLNKTVGAAVKQREDIEFIREKIGLESLPEQLYEIAILRLDNSEATLLELGAMLSTPVGKSGVNHRLRRLSEIAETLKEDSYGNKEHDN